MKPKGKITRPNPEDVCTNCEHDAAEHGSGNFEGFGPCAQCDCRAFKERSARDRHHAMVANTPKKYLIDCFKCGGKGWKLSLQLSEASKKRECRYCFGTGKLENDLAEWSDIIAKVPLTRMASSSIELPDGKLMEPPTFTEDELVYIRESVYMRSSRTKARQSILAKIPASLSSSR